jgi:cell division protein FtsB
MRGVRPTYRHVFVVLAVVVSLYFAVRTSRAVVVDQVLAVQLENAQGGVDTIEQQNAALSSQLAYEQTPAYAEQVARQQLGMMKPGDHVVHVQIAPLPAGAVAAPAPAPTVTAPAAQKASVPEWKRWITLFSSPAPFTQSPSAAK